MKSDIIFGAVGTAATFGLSEVNLALGFMAGVLTVTILCFKLRREWLHRNDPPTDK
jgi:hypothetical protein